MSKRTAQVLACVVLLTMLATYPLLLMGVDRAVASMRNSPVRWIPETFESIQSFRDFVDQFDAHEVILVSWEGATVDDERLENLSNTLLERQTEREGPALYSDVVNGYTQLRTMMSDPMDLSRDAAMLRLQGSLVGQDKSTSCVAVVLTDYGARERDETLAVIMDSVKDRIGLDREEVRLAGPPVDGAAVDQLSRLSLRRYSIPSIIISLILCWICLRSIWFTIPVLLIGAYGQSLCLSLVYFTGSRMNAILIVLPPLVFVLTVSAGVHLVNYFYEEVRCGRGSEAVRRALAKAWPPSSLAAVTTAIGLGSLLVSDVEPVRQFGWLGACGVLATFALLFAVLPGVMYFWLGRYGPTDRRPDGGDPPPVARTWQWAASAILATHYAVTGLCLLAMLGLGWGLTHVKTTVDVVSLLDESVRAVRDAQWFQDEIGPLIPVEVILHFPRDCTADILDRLELTGRVHGELNRIGEIDGAISVATFVPRIPQRRGVRATVQRSIIKSEMEVQKERFIEAGYLRVTDDGEYWRVGARAEGQSDIDYSQFLDTLRDRVQPLVDEFEAKHNTRIDATYTGVTSAVYEVQRALLSDLFNSFLTAVILVGIVMIFVLRSVSAGLMAMIPNVFPTCILFGAMGWLGRPVDVGSVMTASVALGIAVDGTFHFLGSYRRERGEGLSSYQAVAQTYQHCGRALIQTTLICALGLVVFSLSSFLPARNFAWTLMLLLVAAAVGDLVLLPALLVGPIGRLFARNTREGAGE